MHVKHCGNTLQINYETLIHLMAYRTVIFARIRHRSKSTLKGLVMLPCDSNHVIIIYNQEAGLGKFKAIIFIHPEYSIVNGWMNDCKIDSTVWYEVPNRPTPEQ